MHLTVQGWPGPFATGRPSDYADDRFFRDPHPVPAIEELRATGRMAATPRTHLA